ncbi:PopZ family protein [Methylosinus sp. LW4]|uniref:PopZ family protein n=1 Tax=Methylosinus sp. LW4 TaxID=136993 RepID=UPI000399BEDA
MSAMNASITAPALDAERRSHEPSMEEILASIRRIIADDDALPAARRDKEKRPAEPPQREEAPPAPAPALRAPVAARPAAPAPIAAAPAPAPVAVPEVEPAKPAEFWLRPAAAPEAEAAPAPESSDQSRWSEDTAEEVVDETLDEPVVAAAEEPYVQDIADEPVEEQMIASIEPSPAEPANDSDPTPLVSTDAAMSIGAHFQALAASIVISEADLIERYAQDMLRPMLKQWLDDNLPHLVERLVRAEIERVARGRR